MHLILPDECSPMLIQEMYACHSMPVVAHIREVHTSSTSPDYTKCLTTQTSGASTCCRENKPSASPIHKCQLA